MTALVEGKGDDEASPKGAVRVDGEGASVALDDVASDGQAEAGPTCVAVAGLIQAGEALERPLVLSAGIPGPSSLTLSTAVPPTPATVKRTVLAACRAALRQRFPTARSS